MAVSIAVAVRNAELAAYGANFNGGSLVIYSGAAPSSADVALAGDGILATLPFPNPAFQAPVAGVMNANPIAQENTTGTGVASFYRALAADGLTVIEQGVCGVGTGDLQLNRLDLVANGPADVNQFQKSM